MTIRVINFPRRRIDQKRRDAAKGILRCEVSDRWIQFPEHSEKSPDTEYLACDVMTLGSDEKPRKICEIILDKTQLMKMLIELPTNDRT